MRPTTKHGCHPREAWQRLRHSERGQGLVEYALIIVVVSLGTIAALTFLRDNIRGLFSAAGSSIALGDGGSGGSGAGSGGGNTAPVAGTLSISCPGGSCNNGEVATAVVDSPATGNPTPTILSHQWATSSDPNCGGTFGNVGSNQGTYTLGTAGGSADSVRVTVTWTNGVAPNATASACVPWTAPPPAPNNNQGISNGATVGLQGGGNATVTSYTPGGLTGTPIWFTGANISGNPSPDGMYRSNGTQNVSGQNCGFTLSNGYSFSGTWHVADNAWGSIYDNACY